VTELLRDNVSSESLFLFLVLKNAAAELATLKITHEEHEPWGPVRLGSASVENIQADVRKLLRNLESSASAYHARSHSNGATKSKEIFVCFSVENALVEDRQLLRCSGVCSVKWVLSTPSNVSTTICSTLAIGFKLPL